MSSAARPERAGERARGFCLEITGLAGDAARLLSAPRRDAFIYEMGMCHFSGDLACAFSIVGDFN